MHPAPAAGRHPQFRETRSLQTGAKPLTPTARARFALRGLARALEFGLRVESLRCGAWGTGPRQ